MGVGPFAYLDVNAKRVNPNALQNQPGVARVPGAQDGALQPQRQQAPKPKPKGKKTDLKDLFAPQVDPTTGLSPGSVDGGVPGVQGQGVDGGEGVVAGP